MKKILAHESLVFLCCVLFGVVIIPTTVMILLATFGDFPRNQLMYEGYDTLRSRLGSHTWIAYMVAFGPYVCFQLVRLVQWKRRGRGAPNPAAQPEHVPPVSSGTGGVHCDFSLLSWRDGFARIHDHPHTEEKTDG